MEQSILFKIPMHHYVYYYSFEFSLTHGHCHRIIKWDGYHAYYPLKVLMSIPNLFIDGLGAEKLEGAFRRPKSACKI